MGKEIKNKLIIKPSNTHITPVYIIDSSGPVLNSFLEIQYHFIYKYPKR